MSGEGTTSISNLPTDNVYDPAVNVVMETTPVQGQSPQTVSYTHLRAHETKANRLMRRVEGKNK